MGTPRINITPFGEFNGRPVQCFELDNGQGLKAAFSDYGATLLSLTTPDREGREDDVTLGFNTLADYLADGSFMGALIGRYGNRIGGPRFTLDGRQYMLAVTDGEGRQNCLHGGKQGFDKKLWCASACLDNGEPSLRLSYRSADGEEGFPGTLDVTVTYRLTRSNAWQIDYEAVTDAPTVLSLTHHAYFNLNGESAGEILDHEAQVHSDALTAVNSDFLPTGQLYPVAHTPLDFNTPKVIGSCLGMVDPQLTLAGQSIDHNFVVRGEPGTLRPCAEVYAPQTGRVLSVETTEPGVQFYIGGSLSKEEVTVGKSGKPYLKHHAFCLETQHFPDSPNRPEFPSTVLRPGETFRSTTTYRFSVR